MFYFLLLSLACSKNESPMNGIWKLSGQNVTGVIKADSKSLQVGVWGDKWGTDGLVPAKIAVQEDVRYLYFTLQTGLGAGDATLRLQGQEALLPLGSRSGEFEISMLSEETDSLPEDLEMLQKKNQLAVEQERKYWKNGFFTLISNTNTVGDFHYTPQNGETTVAVYDQYWLTEEIKYPKIHAKGADLFISFAVSPSLRGEYGLLVINVPTRKAVVPVGELPDDLDRYMQLVPERLTPAQRSDFTSKAIELSNKIEKKWVLTNVNQLIQAAKSENDCLQFDKLDPKLQAVWLGYHPQISNEHGKCIVELNPNPIQHRRRVSGKFE